MISVPGSMFNDAIDLGVMTDRILQDRLAYERCRADIIRSTTPEEAFQALVRYRADAAGIWESLEEGER